MIELREKILFKRLNRFALRGVKRLNSFKGRHRDCWMEEMIKNEGLGEVIDTVKGLIAKTDIKIQQVVKK